MTSAIRPFHLAFPVRDLGEAHHLRACALERRVEPRAGDAVGPCFRDALSCPFECLFVHGAKATLAVG